MSFLNNLLILISLDLISVFLICFIMYWEKWQSPASVDLIYAGRPLFDFYKDRYLLFHLLHSVATLNEIAGNKSYHGNGQNSESYVGHGLSGVYTSRVEGHHDGVIASWNIHGTQDVVGATYGCRCAIDSGFPIGIIDFREYDNTSPLTKNRPTKPNIFAWLLRL